MTTKPRESVPRTIILTKEMDARVRHVAKRRGISMSMLCSQLVRDGLDEEVVLTDMLSDQSVRKIMVEVLSNPVLMKGVLSMLDSAKAQQEVNFDDPKKSKKK